MAGVQQTGGFSCDFQLEREPAHHLLELRDTLLTVGWSIALVLKGFRRIRHELVPLTVEQAAAHLVFATQVGHTLGPAEELQHHLSFEFRCEFYLAIVDSFIGSILSYPVKWVSNFRGPL